MHRDAFDDAGIVHQDVDGTHFGMNLLHQGVDGLFIGHVADIAAHVLDSGRVIGIQPFLARGFVGTVEYDPVRSGGRIRARDAEADAVGTARNPRVLTLQGKQVSGHHISTALYFGTSVFMRVQASR